MDAGDVDADAYEGLLDVGHECCWPADVGAGIDRNSEPAEFVSCDASRHGVCPATIVCRGSAVEDVLMRVRQGREQRVCLVRERVLVAVRGRRGSTRSSRSMRCDARWCSIDRTGVTPMPAEMSTPEWFPSSRTNSPRGAATSMVMPARSVRLR